MTKQEFDDLLFEMEMMVIESFMWPVALIVDPKILAAVHANPQPTKIKLRGTLEEIPIELGKPGEFRLKPSTLADENVK